MAAKRTPASRVAIAVGAGLAVVVFTVCGSSDEDQGDGGTASGAAEGETVEAYAVESSSCPPEFSLARNATGSPPIEFEISNSDAGGSGFASADTVDVDCVSDADEDPFPFTASEIEFTVSPDGSIDGGSATWSDSVGLSMNALISGSADDSLDQINLELTAPNGDTLSELTFVSSS